MAVLISGSSCKQEQIRVKRGTCSQFVTTFSTADTRRKADAKNTPVLSQSCLRYWQTNAHGEHQVHTLGTVDMLEWIRQFRMSDIGTLRSSMSFLLAGLKSNQVQAMRMQPDIHSEHAAAYCHCNWMDSMQSYGQVALLHPQNTSIPSQPLYFRLSATTTLCS